MAGVRTLGSTPSRRRRDGIRRRRQRRFAVRPVGRQKLSGRKPKVFLRGVLTMHRQYLNHPCLRNRHQFDMSNREAWVICAARQIHVRAARQSRTADPRRAARRIRTTDPCRAARHIRAPRHLRHPFPVRSAPAHPDSSRRRRGMRCDVAAPRSSRDGAPPCLSRNTAAARRPPYRTRRPTGCRPYPSSPSRSHDREVR